jgi:hypothetical protein
MTKPLRKKHTQGAGNRCRWFALCNRAVTTAIPHPVLGMVPCCDRCAVSFWQAATIQLRTTNASTDAI